METKSRKQKQERLDTMREMLAAIEEALAIEGLSTRLQIKQVTDKYERLAHQTMLDLRRTDPEIINYLL